MPAEPFLKDFLRFAWEHSPFYRDLYTRHGLRAGDLGHVSLQDLPIVTKQLLRDNFDQVVTDTRITRQALNEWLEIDKDPHSRYLGEYVVITSSATSSTRSNNLYSKTEWRNMATVAAAYLYPGRPQEGSRYRTAFYISNLAHAASVATAVNSSPVTFDSLVIPIFEPVDQVIARLNAFKPDRLTSYSSSLGWLAELALDGRLKIAPRDVVVSADRLTPQVERLIRQAWNPNIYDLYAASESLFMAVKQPGQAEWKILEELQTIEVLDEQGRQVQPGALGRPILTNWNNRSVPHIRYDLTDYVVCGDTRPGRLSLRAFAGRPFDNLPGRLADGSAGLIPSYALVEFGVSMPDAFQFVTYSPDEMELQYCAPADMDELLRPRLVEFLERWGAGRTHFSLKRVAHIWNNGESYKVTLVRKPDEPQIGLPQDFRNTVPERRPAIELHPGGGSSAPAAALPGLPDLLRFAWEHSAFYRDLYSAQGLREKDLLEVRLADLPIINKQMLRENYDRVVTDPRISAAGLDRYLQQDNDPGSRFLGKYLVIHTTGSSGNLINMLYDEADWRRMTAAAAAYLYPAKRTGGRYRNAFFIGDRRHVASATTAVNAARDTFEYLLVSMRAPIESTLAKLNAFQPDRLTSYSSSLGWLAELALDGRLKIAPRDVLASSDRLTPAIERLIRQAWNPNIYDLYAASEALYMAVKQPGQAEWKILEDLQTIEVLDEQGRQVQPGGLGKAVLTNWTSHALPLIRYDLTDTVICGDIRPGNLSLRGFAGRAFDSLPIRLADGSTGAIPSHALLQFGAAGPDAFQFVSHSPDEVQLQYCASEPLDEEMLHRRLAGLLESWGAARTNFSVQRVGHLWNDDSSLKFKLVRFPADLQIGAKILEINQPVEPEESLRPGGGFVPMERAVLDQSIAALFEKQVARTPEAVAIQDGTLQMTFAALNRTANRVAHALLARGMDPARPAVLLFNQRASMLPAMLGVIKAGGWYAPLDPSHPPARNAPILQEIQAGLALTDNESLGAAGALGFSAQQIINVEALDQALEQVVDDSNPGLPAQPGDLVCILYTSGSTGRPKGVLLDQRAVLHRAYLYTNDYAIGPQDRLALLQSYVFNASVREIFAALQNGAGLYLYSLKREGIHHLADWLQEQRISVLYMVPAIFRAFLEELPDQRFEHLRLIRLGAESVLARDVAGFRRHFGPGCLLANGLAATETGTTCQYFMSRHTYIFGSSAPVGLPVQDKEIRLLDEDGRPVEDGATGEIVVASRFFGPGYFTPAGVPDKTAPATQRQAAQEAPGSSTDGMRTIHTGDMGYRLPDGKIVLVGRKDAQVKLRGQRMNLLEIEQALLALDNIAGAAVTLQSAQDGTAFLAAFIQPKVPPAPAENELRQALRTRLPQSMIPAVFQSMDRLPLTESGKIDRLRLPAVTRGRAAGQHAAAAFETPTQQALAQIWEKTLGIGQVAPDDNFFELGGDSMLAAQMMAQIEATFRRSVPLSILFQHESLRDLAAAIAEGAGPAAQDLLVTIQPQGYRTPIYFFSGQAGAMRYLHELTEAFGNQRPLFGLSGADLIDANGNARSIEQVAEDYARAIRAARPHGPYILAGFSYGGYYALEGARWLAAQGEPGLLVLLLDTFPPIPFRTPPPAVRAKYHLSNLRKLNGLKELSAYLWDGLQRIFRRLSRRMRTRPASEPANSPARIAKVALEIFRPRPYSCDVILFKTTNRQKERDWDITHNWKKLINGELTIINVAGGHAQMVKNLNAITLARQIEQALPETEDRKADRPGVPDGQTAPVIFESPTQQALGLIWQQTLETGQVAPGDNFFDLGGNSLQAARMMTQIEAAFRRKVPLSVLYEHESLREFAGYLDSENNSDMQKLLVPLQPQGSQPPIFFFPGKSAALRSLSDLTERLGSWRAVFGLSSVDFVDADGRTRTIEQVAEQYARAIQNARPHGPYILAGYSFGGYFALEVARWLVAQGESQPLVLLLDTFPPIPYRATPPAVLAKFHFDNLRSLRGLKQVAVYFRDGLRRMYQRRVTAKAQPPVYTAQPPSSPGDLALELYRPAVFPLNVVLFMSIGRQHVGNWDFTHNWEKLVSGRFEIVRVPGDHFQMVANPHALVLADQIEAIIKQHLP